MFLAYETPHPNRVKCDYNNPPPPGKSCEVNLNDFTPCTAEKNYELTKKSICVFLKLRKNPSWKPEYYNATSLPDKMPADLKEFIQKSGKSQQKMAWVSCEPDRPVDQELIGSIEYFPTRGFSESQILSTDEPFIAVHFQNPTKGLVIAAKCTLWTRNASDNVSFDIIYD